MTIVNNIELDITRECNFQCPSCLSFSNLFNKNSKSIMTLEEIYSILSKFKQHDLFINRLEILGGEPTLHPQFKEICIFLQQYLKYNKIVKNVFLYTNHSNKKIVKWCSLTTNFIIIASDIAHKPVHELMQLKAKSHFNLYAVDKIDNLPLDICDICDGIKLCGLTIYKFDNKIKYAVCCYSAFIARLLEQEDSYTFNSIIECLDFLNTNKASLIANICCYCLRAYLTVNHEDMEECTKYKDFRKINGCFSEGYNHMVNNLSMFN